MSKKFDLPGLFFVGTDTGVGKTFVTARIARQLVEERVSVGVYKPACSGCVLDAAGQPVWEDVEFLSEAVHHQFPKQRICPQQFRAALAPPVAAEREGAMVEESLLVEGIQWWRGKVDVLLIEGVGGLLCPVSRNWSIADLAARWGFPVVIVARRGLGTINHTLLTVEVAQSRGLDVVGILLNEPSPQEAGLAGESNAEEIAKRCDVPILAGISYRKSDGLRPFPETNTINWQKLAKDGSPI